MKATLDIPDELYRQVKAKSALEGRPIREVAIELFHGWLEGPQERAKPEGRSKRESKQGYPPWFGAFRKYAVHARNRHDMDSIRESIVRGRSEGERG